MQSFVLSPKKWISMTQYLSRLPWLYHLCSGGFKSRGSPAAGIAAAPRACAARAERVFLGRSDDEWEIVAGGTAASWIDRERGGERGGGRGIFVEKYGETHGWLFNFLLGGGTVEKTYLYSEIFSKKMIQDLGDRRGVGREKCFGVVSRKRSGHKSGEHISEIDQLEEPSHKCRLQAEVSTSQVRFYVSVTPPNWLLKRPCLRGLQKTKKITCCGLN